MKPVLRWTGSKRSVKDKLRTVFSDHWNGRGTFWEPFCGSLSVSLMVLETFQPKRIVVADVNPCLVLFYHVVRDHVDALVATLQTLPDDYYANRDMFNRTDMADSLQKACLFYYLNATGFNGLYRCNAKGAYNTPWGHRPFVICETSLRSLSHVLKKNAIAIHAMPFQTFFETFECEFAEGDLIYVDPPYDTTFVQYDRSGFTTDAQRSLRDACRSAKDKGVVVVASNSDTPLVRDLYADGFDIIPFENKRFFEKGSARGATMELIMVGRRHLETSMHRTSR